ncbi:MAG: ABC transporter ATP-binding protein [Candidatus Kapabacteria bacterium]|nr:ABC transporter ATP-binding protein [Candidatus Kapabacteria bacterium]
MLTTRYIVPRVLVFVKPFTGLFILAMVFNLMFSVMNALTLAIVEPVFRTLFGSGQAPAGIASTIPSAFSPKAAFDAYVYGLILGPDMTTTIRNLGTAMFLLFLFRAATKYVATNTSVRVEEGIMKSIRDALFSRMTSLSLDFFARKRTGDLISVLTNDVGVLNHSTVNSLSQLWREATTIIVYLVLLLLISVKLTVMAIAIAAIGVIFIRMSTSYLRRYAQRMQAAQADYTTILQESLQGIRVVKGMSLEQTVFGRFAGQTAQYVRSAVKNSRVTTLVPAVNELFGIAAIVAVFYAGGVALAANEITAPNLMTFLFLLFGLMQPISIIVNVFAVMQRGIVAANNVLSVLDEVPNVTSGSINVTRLSSSISVEHVSFSYEAESSVLRDVSFNIPRGRTVALVGTSGSGKSTILDLLLRFYDPSQGTIRIDGMDIREASLESYRRLFGTVSQETMLFNDTVARNIALGEASPDMERVQQAAGIAHAHDFIMAMPNGYNTTIGDRGMKMSGGQRQRLAIARALYRNPEVLVFDEATSALDSASERDVQDAINSVLSGRTAVVVAHRLSTIINADVILVFDNGRIIERGTHAELLQARGTYARLYTLQFSTADEQDQ